MWGFWCVVLGSFLCGLVGLLCSRVAAATTSKASSGGMTEEHPLSCGEEQLLQHSPCRSCLVLLFSLCGGCCDKRGCSGGMTEEHPQPRGEKQPLRAQRGQSHCWNAVAVPAVRLGLLLFFSGVAEKVPPKAPMNRKELGALQPGGSGEGPPKAR